MLDPEFTSWLFSSSIPSIRYLTLRDLLQRPASDPEMEAAWAEMRTNGPIPAILARQTPQGSWMGESDYYTPKYTSTHWSMLLLAELAADPATPGVRQGAVFMLENTHQGLARRLDEGRHSLECFWANALRYSQHAGLGSQPQFALIVEALVGDALQGEWRCPYNSERPCAWGAGRTLWALAALPAHQRTERVQAAEQSAVAFLLEEYDLLKADYPSEENGRRHTLWSHTSFPLFYQADTLLILRALAELGRLDHPGAAGALDWLAARRDRHGHWTGSSPYRQRTWREMGAPAETSRWVSLQAALILQAHGVDVGAP